MSSDLEKYRKMALDLWLTKNGSCSDTNQSPDVKDIDDAINEDEEFKRIENQNKK